MKIYASLAALGILLLAGTGCQNTVNTVETEDKNMTVNTVKDNRYVTDSFLRDRLRLVGVNTSETPEGLMRAQLTAVNVRTGVFAQAWSSMTNDNPYRVLYKFTWFDGNGMEVESILSSWHERRIIPGETVQFQSVAPRKDCKDFRIELKEAP
jgi:uncharacterized protein YcfL